MHFHYSWGFQVLKILQFSNEPAPILTWINDPYAFKILWLGRKTKSKFFDLEDEIDSRDTLQLQEKVLTQEHNELPKYEFKQIIASTDNFSYRNKLGQGGFGAVYKGMLDHGQQIAVKRLSGHSGQGSDEFKNEIMLISKLQHRNLVRLLGYCIEGKERLLIYEYMTNKSLDAFLFDPKKRRQLHWATRFNIILGIGRGLIYLHRDSCLRIIDRDLKCSNILLDEQMNPKISDFGLARTFQMAQELANTRRVVGTYGYMSPEYVMRGVFSEKSDVFSYGVMLLEIISGKRNAEFIHHEQIYPLRHAWKSWSEGRGVELIDRALAETLCLSQGLRCIHVGLLCVQDQAKDRPTMAEAVSLLCSKTDLPEPKEPLFMAADTLTKDSSISLEQTLVSANQVFELGFFNPGNSTKRYIGIWYKDIPARKVIWVANRENPLSVSNTNSSLSIGNDGNLRIQDGEQKIVWSTNVRVQLNETTAKLTDTGDLTLNDTISGSILWESFDYPGNSLLPGMKLGTKGKTLGKNLLTSWKSDDDPTPGEFVLGLSVEQPPQAFIWHGSKPYWRSGPWDGGKFIGIPEQESGYANVISLMPDNPQEGAYLTINRYNATHIRWLYLKPDGVLQLNYWDDDLNMWDVTWGAPYDPCDVYGVCGAFAICTNKSPTCECLSGFVPRSKDEWRKENWTKGCMRRSELSCEKYGSSLASGKTEPDKFRMLRRIKLPDHHQYFPYTNTSECQRLCLGNCSCKAYAYVEGIYCMIWTEDLMDIKQFSFGGENLFLRLAYVESGRKTKLKPFNSEDEIDSRDPLQLQEAVLTQESIELPIYEFKQIIASTDNFSYKNKLGEGGFGPVYKGLLDHGQQIAVKRLSGDSGQGIEEFKNEIMLISKLQHRNLVKLLGCCIEGDERLLIYEYMTNKSLDTFLFGKFDSTSFSLGIGRGLIYLHRDSCLRIIHRDLKCSNILVDENMNPKISDFGLARTFQMPQELANTRRIVGTYGYMSPEYAMRGIFSEKSDVFSYGVMLLEIVSGKKNTEFLHYEHPLGHAWKSWKERRGIELMDQALVESSFQSQALRCIHIGLLCVQDLAEDRPTMAEAVSMLCSETELPEPKEPLFTLQRLSGTSIGQDSENMCSINGITISMMEGR
ncbi:hypothetical protein OSB04_002335 [Centaurea solstitialis]|uniref:non-specific serine/threonine protein kinase n=1 Tax=Centaurea solstitialis TaxID=347529 RepID=A0AA38TT60_9ASTR|nr:hypothetical protein OSB04_002335 [Centaurea solstitialis]